LNFNGIKLYFLKIVSKIIQRADSKIQTRSQRRNSKKWTLFLELQDAGCPVLFDRYAERKYSGGILSGSEL
jgi:hypothetical protein